jgi:hypothetical protein
MEKAEGEPGDPPPGPSGGLRRQASMREKPAIYRENT